MKAKKDYWEGLFKNYEQSGLSQEAFCSKQGSLLQNLSINGVKRQSQEATSLWRYHSQQIRRPFTFVSSRANLESIRD